MKNYKKILSLVLIIFSICLSSCTDEIQKKICDKNFVYKGLSHTTLGNAELSIDEENEHFYIENLNAADEDGVAISVPASQNLNLFFEPVDVPENAALVQEIFPWLYLI